MKYIFQLFMLLPFALQAQQTLTKTITHDGMTREYIIHIPNSYDGNSDVPLLLCFHGYTSNANTIMSYSGFNTKSNQNNFIVAYPQGTLLDGATHWNVGGWTLNSTVDDVDFTDKLLDTIMNDYTIDQNRVYSTGMSNGGYMSFLLACQLSDRFAAIASVTGSMTPQTYNACNPTHPTPVLQIHGTSDGTVPYNGNSTWTKSINDVLNYWQTNNNCNTTATISDIENTNTTDGSTVEKFKYNICDDCSDVEHYKVTGGDHDWPGVWGNMDIDATDLVWNFLIKYDMNGLIGCGTLNHDLIEISCNLNYYKSEFDLTINGLQKEFSKYSVYNLDGKIIDEGMITLSNNTIDTTPFHSGMYILKIENYDAVKFIME